MYSLCRNWEKAADKCNSLAIFAGDQICHDQCSIKFTSMYRYTTYTVSVCCWLLMGMHPTGDPIDLYLI